MEIFLNAAVGQIPLVSTLTRLVTAAVFLLMGFLLATGRAAELSAELPDANLWGIVLVLIGAVHGIAVLASLVASRRRSTFRVNMLSWSLLSGFLAVVGIRWGQFLLPTGEYTLQGEHWWSSIFLLAVLAFFTLQSLYTFGRFLIGR